MADDMTGKIKDILNNPEMMNMLSSLIGSDGERRQSPTDISPDISSMISGLSFDNDKRINLLNALKPYMKGNKSSNIDKAIKMIKLTKLSSIIKDL
ncbi:MAG: hypothetical protein IJN40_05350 [Clostridia bacterium]|nr:hypothetical protein [Clostridia bacterium]